MGIKNYFSPNDDDGDGDVEYAGVQFPINNNIIQFVFDTRPCSTCVNRNLRFIAFDSTTFTSPIGKVICFN